MKRHYVLVAAGVALGVALSLGFGVANQEIEVPKKKVIDLVRIVNENRIPDDFVLVECRGEKILYKDVKKYVKDVSETEFDCDGKTFSFQFN